MGALWALVWLWLRLRDWRRVATIRVPYGALPVSFQCSRVLARGLASAAASMGMSVSEWLLERLQRAQPIIAVRPVAVPPLDPARVRPDRAVLSFDAGPALLASLQAGARASGLSLDFYIVQRLCAEAIIIQGDFVPAPREPPK